MAPDTRLTQDPTELDAIWRFRFSIYYDELGAQLPDSAVHTRLLQCDLDEVAYQYASFMDGQVVGCVRVVDLKDIQNDTALIEKYRLKDVIRYWGRDVITFTGRMAVAEPFRKSSLVVRLMALATDEARQRGMRVAFLDCSPHLLPFYEAFGFRRYAPAFSDPIFGFKQPLVFMLRDHAGLKAIGSPLARTGQYKDDPEIRAWYTGQFGVYATVRTATLLPNGAFTDLVESVFSGELKDIPLFHSLSRQEIDLVLKKSTVVSALPGDVVIRSGLRDGYLGVVLSGRLEAHHAGHHLESLKGGDFWGETEFLTRRPRIAEVVAHEAAELLIVQTDYLAQLIERDVVLGRTIMKNLAVAMATRSAARLDAMRPFLTHQLAFMGGAAEIAKRGA